MNPTKKNRLLFIITLLLELAIIGCSGAIGYILGQRKEIKDQTTFPIFQEAYDLLIASVYDPLPENKLLEYGMIRGLLQPLNDPYTNFVEPPQHELQTEQLSGKYGGIGARIEQDSNRAWRLFPLPDSPAIIAGIQDGDLLLQIDDILVTNDTPLDTIRASLHGEVDTVVNIIVQHIHSSDTASLSVRRAEFSQPSVTWNVLTENKEVGIIHIGIIAATTPDEILAAATDLQLKGSKYLIIDLRNNYGGLVDAGVNTARIFLKQGQILQQQYRDKAIETFSVEKPGLLSDIPIVVLVNQNTASAAEIVAGAIQAQKRASLIGVPTYGKDSIQLIFELQDGSSLHVTAARWWVPGLTDGEKSKQLQPDILLGNDADNADYLQRALQTLLP